MNEKNCAFHLVNDIYYIVVIKYSCRWHDGTVSTVRYMNGGGSESGEFHGGLSKFQVSGESTDRL